MVGNSNLDFYGKTLGFHEAIPNTNAKIWVFWKHDLQGKLLESHSQFLHIHFKSRNFEGLGTFVYAHCQRSIQRNLWESLTTLASNIALPWIVAGDFNVIRYASEKMGGNLPNPNHMAEFSDCILDCGLSEIPYSRSPFTWTNNKIWECLDRVLSNANWTNYFTSAKVEHLSHANSDHCPLIITMSTAERNFVPTIRFQNMWISHHEFDNSILNSWSISISGPPLIQLWLKLKDIKIKLKKWNKEVFGNLFTKLIESENEAKRLERKNESLWSTFMKTKYLRGLHPMLCTMRNTASAIWNRMFKIRNEAEKFIAWEIGPGQISFWFDNWVGSSSLASLFPLGPHDERRVVDFLNNQGWNNHSLEGVVPQHWINRIMQIPLSNKESDRCLFTRSPNQCFSFNTVWQEMRVKRPTLWEGNTGVMPYPKKYPFLIGVFLILLSPWTTLCKLGVFLKCLCCNSSEDMEHLFLRSKIAEAIWKFYSSLFDTNFIAYTNISNCLTDWRAFKPWATKTHIRFVLPVIIFWCISTARNDAKYRNMVMTPFRIKSKTDNMVRILVKAKVLGTNREKPKVSNYFNITLGKNPKKRKSTTHGSTFWLKPKPTFFKLNFACTTANGRGGAGFVLRDYNNMVHYGLHLNFEVTSNWEAYLRGTLLAIQICVNKRSLHNGNIIIESDHSSLTRFSRSSALCNWVNYHLFYTCYSLLRFLTFILILPLGKETRLLLFWLL
ncbi:hypothetical protein KSP39_PZI024511 [Platanthera zijinensis]|uniref:Endonuclease/exonuclease/phosphatase domain-containing protein n=1 Tax=Platanthera zijinensis TaxID=2320716 RepID=A0AAP0AS16_9ASPA